MIQKQNFKKLKLETERRKEQGREKRKRKETKQKTPMRGIFSFKVKVHYQSYVDSSFAVDVEELQA